MLWCVWGFDTPEAQVSLIILGCLLDLSRCALLQASLLVLLPLLMRVLDPLTGLAGLRELAGLGGLAKHSVVEACGGFTFV